MADWPEFRAADILGVLVAHGVDFVVVGGLAVVFHGSTRITQDLDVCYSTEPANLEVLGQALIELEAKLFGIDEDVPFVPDAKALARTEILTLATKHGKLDLLRSPAARPLPELRQGASWCRRGLRDPRRLPEDLIAMKQSAGRAKDLADIEELEAIVDVRRRASGDGGQRRQVLHRLAVVPLDLALQAESISAPSGPRADSPVSVSVTSQASSPTGVTAISTSIHFTVGAIPSPRCTWRWGRRRS